MGPADARLMAYDSLRSIRVECAGGVAWATIDHPPMNLWDAQLGNDLVSLVGAFETNDDAQVLVLTSADAEYFIAHADVTMIMGLPPEATATHGGPAPINQLLERLRLMPKVSIALLRGRARGGGSETPLACALRVATPATRLAQPEVALGIVPGAGGTQRLTRLVGRARALEIVLGCGDVTGDAAARIASMPRHAVAAAKQAVDAALPDPTPGLVVEGAAFHETRQHADTARRMREFL